MKVIASMDFVYKNLGKFKKGNEYEVDNDETTQKLIKVGYFLEFKEVEKKEEKKVVETKEHKAKKATK